MAYVVVPGSNDTLEYDNAATASLYTDSAVGANSVMNTNLLSDSVDLNSSFPNQFRTTITANAGESPFGTNNATLMAGNADTNTKVLFKFGFNTPSVGDVQSFSVFVKNSDAGTGGTFQLEIGNSAQRANVRFNMATGARDGFTTSSEVSHTSSTITDFGNGWYRCTLTVTYESGWNKPNTNIGMQLNDTTANDPGVFLYGAQIEAGATVTPYLETAGTAISGGVRTYDKPGTTKTKPLQSYIRTRMKGAINLQTHSEDFNSWTNEFSITKTTGQEDPNGNTTATNIKDNGDGSENNRLIWENGILPTGSTTYTQSCFIKSNQNNLFQLSFRGNSTNVTSAVFNLDTGVVAHTYNSGDNTLGQTSIHALDNGWFRCRLTATLGTLGDGRISIGPVDEIGNLSVNGYARYVGNGNTGCDIWGLMVSEGANLRKYIKTTSSASSTIETGELSKTYYDGQI